MMFFGPNAASPPKNTPGRVDWKRHLVDVGHIPLVELDAQVALDPRKRVLLADGQDDVVGRQEFLAHDALGGDAPLRINVVFHLVEQHPGQLAVLEDKRLR